MKVALFALAGSYSHSNLAIRTLRPPLLAEGFEVVLIEGNLSDTDGNLLDILYSADADIYGFSCYIWNVSKMLFLAADLKSLRPSAKIVLGGPEASFGEARFEGLSYVDHVVCGAGEAAFSALCASVRDGIAAQKIIRADTFELTDGILYLPDESSKKLMYYESSRGCPYSCAYCLSSATRGVKAKAVDQTLAELYEFEKFDGDITVKLVDRTFNFDISRANAIWRGLLDQKYTKEYHFEICASLLSEESYEILSRFAEGKVRLEVGLQSVNEKTLSACARHIDPEAVLAACRRIKDTSAVHLHLDLICGLPGDTYADIRRAFDRAYPVCSVLQLGFLKLLFGTPLRRDAERLGIKYKSEPPYEVLSTNELSYAELRRLHDISDLLDRFSESGKFSRTLGYIFSRIPSPFDFFDGLSDYIKKTDGRQIRKIGQNDAFALIFGFAKALPEIDEDRLTELLHGDFSAHEVHRAPYFLRKDEKK